MAINYHLLDGELGLVSSASPALTSPSRCAFSVMLNISLSNSLEMPWGSAAAASPVVVAVDREVTPVSVLPLAERLVASGAGKARVQRGRAYENDDGYGAT